VNSFRDLFHICCRHGYFADGVHRSVTLSPTPDCRRLLDRYGCFFRSYSGGAGVYYSDEALIRSFDETAPFVFTLNGSATDLAGMTDIPAANSATTDSSIFSFSNLSQSQASAGPGTFLPLHDGAAFAGPPLPLRPPRFTHPLGATVRDADLQIVGALGAAVLAIRAPARPISSVSPDLTGVPEGAYRLMLGHAKLLDFYLTAASSIRRWGAISIFAGGPKMSGVPLAGRVLGDNGPLPQPPEFAISLDPRKSVWRYLIISQSAADRTYADCRIIGSTRGNGAAPMVFSKPEPQTVLGKAAWLFTSDAPIPLYERPSDKFEFLLKRDTAAEGAGVALPYAGTADTGQFSDIYVYL
jgi:hypothetical protein